MHRPPPLGGLVLGLLLVAAGVIWLLDATGTLDVSWGVLVPAALIAVGLAVAIGSFTGQRTGGLVALGVVLAAFAALFAILDVPPGGGVGERTERPRLAAELERSYELVAGKLVVDLSRLQVPAGHTRIQATVAMGELQVILPAGVPVLVEGEVTAGEVQVLERSARGISANTAHRDPDYEGADRRLTLDLSVGLGKIEVRR